MKKILTLFLCLAMVMAVLPIVPINIYALASYEPDSQGVSYLRGAAGFSFVCRCEKTATGNIKIASYFDGFPVSRIYDNAFKGCTGITSITFPDSIEGTLYGTFKGCTGLKNITIPAKITSIGESTFDGCTGLTSITIPNGVTSIGKSAFAGCTGLTSITIPDSVTSIDEFAFAGCTGLTSITIPDSVTSMGSGIFKECTNLTSISVPFLGTYDGKYFKNAFLGYFFGATSESDNNKYVPQSLETVKVTKGPYIDGFKDCANLTNIIMSDSITTIEYGAFENCTGLSIITIPSGVTSIPNRYIAGVPDGIFSGCTGLEKIVVSKGNKTYHSAGNCLIETASKKIIAGCKNSVIPADGSVTCIGEAAFNNCTELTNMIIPDGIMRIGDRAFDGCTDLTSIVLSDSVTSIGCSAFAHCIGLTNVTIPDSVISLGEYAFFACSNLKSVTMPQKINSIERATFTACSKLTNVTIPDGVKSIGYEAFKGCGFANIIIPDSVTSIGDGAFCICDKLLEIIIPDSVTSIEAFAFAGCTALKMVKLPDKLMTINKHTFRNCENLTSVIMPDTVRNIGERAFSGCWSLSSLTIPDGVTDIGEKAFFDCGGLEKISVDRENEAYHSDGNCLIETASKTLVLGCKNSVVPADGSVISIGDNAFYGCKGLQNIEIPNCIISIGDSAFRGCEGLSSITIPSSVKSIEREAFFQCEGLTNIEILYGVTSIGKSAFGATKKVTDVIIPNSVTSIGDYAFSSTLTSITVPNSVTSIGDGAVGGGNSVIKCHEGSYAQEYAINKGYIYKTIHFSDENEWYSNTAEHYHICDVCGKKFNKAEHSGGEATCTLKAECEICGKYYGEKNSENHKHTELRNFEKGDCENAGYTGDLFCIDCGKQLTTGILIEPIGSHFSADNKWHSDTNEHYHICDVCGKQFDNATHAGGEATCISQAECEICGKYYGEKNGENHKHTELRNAKPGDCGNAGYTGDTFCTDCEKQLTTGTVIEPTGKHNCADDKRHYVKGESYLVCDTCGQKYDIQHYTPGDFNGDDGVTDADAIYLLMHTYFPEDYPIEQNCDYNGDGEVNDADAIYLLMHSYFPDEYPINI